MDMNKRDALISKVRNFVKRDKKGHLKYKNDIIHYLEELLSCKENRNLELHNKWKNIYSDCFYTRIKQKMFLPFRLVVYFPWDGVKISLTRGDAEKIAYFQNIIDNKYSEEAIKFKCVVPGNYVVDGPLIIISMASIESIVMPDGDILQKHLTPPRCY